MLLSVMFVVASLFATSGAAPAARTPAVPQAARVAAAPTAAEILASVQKFYGGVQGLATKFRQEVTNATFGRSDVSDGQLFVSKPGKMRWNYYARKRAGQSSKIAKEIVSDGSFLYVVDHDNKQVIKKDLRKDLLPVAVGFLYGKGDLAAEFTPALDPASGFGTKTDHVLKLTPKHPSVQYTNLYLVIDPTNFRVKESIIIDAAGNKNRLRFYEPSFDPKLDAAKIFGFSLKSSAVKNYRVVDGDAAPAK